MKILKRITKNHFLLSFLLSLFLGACIIVPQIIRGGIGSLYFTSFSDFTTQQIPFNMAINNAIKSGNFMWARFNGLGSNMIGAFSFYNMFSPFNIIGYLFPADCFRFLVGPIFILKYGVTGLTSYLFLKRYVKNKHYAVIGSLLYTFSGFQLTNMPFYHFHDAVAFFPLILYALDNLVYDNKKGRFALFIALSAFTNWFFLIEEIIFIVIYYWVKAICKSYKFSWKKTLQVLFEGIIGCGIAAVVLIPTALFVSGNPRLDELRNLKDSLFYSKDIYFELIRSFIFPSTTMYVHPIIRAKLYSSTELYLPLVGFICAISYLIKHKKSWESMLLLICIIIMFVPILNSTFVLFNSSYYSRWFFMPTLIMALMSIKLFEDNNKISNKLFFSWILVIIIYIIGIITIYYSWDFIHDLEFLVVIICLTFICLIITRYIANLKGSIKVKTLYLLISIFIIAYGNYNVYKYSPNNYTQKLYTNKYYAIDDIFEFSSNNRINTNECLKNEGYSLQLSNLASFNSNFQPSMFQFYGDLGLLEQTRLMKETVKEKELNNFLGVEYIISCNNDNLTKYGYKKVDTKEEYSLYYNDDYKTQGFHVDNYMPYDEYNKLSKKEKINALNEYIILNDEQIQEYKNLYTINVNNYDNSYFKYIRNGFESIITTDQDTLAIYTIPHDRGWKAYINHNETKIEEVDNGMMAVKVNKGKNKIIFKYLTPGLKTGTIVSTISALLLALYFIIERRK